MGHLLGLLKNIDLEKYHFSLVADKGDYLIDEIRELNIPVHFVKMMNWRFNLKAPFDIAKVCKAEGADIIHCHGTRAAFFGAFAKKLCNINSSIYTVHGFSYNKDMRKGGSRFYLAIERFLGRSHDRLISVSEFDKKEAIKKGVCAKYKIQAVSNAIDFDTFDPTAANGAFRKKLGLKKNIKLIGAAARLVPQKGMEFFLKGAKLVKQTHPEVKFVIVGKGELSTKLMDLADKNGLSDSVIFTGPSKSMRDVYSGIDIFVLPSLWEGHPLTLIEALAMKKPTVATCTSGSPEIIEDGKSGILVPPKDPLALSVAIKRLLDDMDYGKSLAERGSKSVRNNFSLAKMSSSNEMIFNDLLENGNGAIRNYG